MLPAMMSSIYTGAMYIYSIFCESLLYERSVIGVGIYNIVLLKMTSHQSMVTSLPQARN